MLAQSRASAGSPNLTQRLTLGGSWWVSPKKKSLTSQRIFCCRWKMSLQDFAGFVGFAGFAGFAWFVRRFVCRWSAPNDYECAHVLVFLCLFFLKGLLWRRPYCSRVGCVAVAWRSSAYVSIRQHTSEYVRIRQDTEVSIRQHSLKELKGAYGRAIRLLLLLLRAFKVIHLAWRALKD